MNPEDAQFISDVRMQMLANKQAGRPEDEGIDREKLKRCIAMIRETRGKASESRAASKKKVEPASAEEIKDLFS